METWRRYQDQVGDLFGSLGLDKATDVRLAGVRTTHDIDVLVTGHASGIEFKWLVECKAWKRRITKQTVLALRSIVDDLGADRGFIMAEGGYQKGALEAATGANITLTSLYDLQVTLAFDLGLARLRTIEDRMESCRRRYWDLSHADRESNGLHPEATAPGYNGEIVLLAVDRTLIEAFRHGYPFRYGLINAANAAHSTRWFEDETDPVVSGPDQLFILLTAELIELERRLTAAELTTRRLVTDRVSAGALTRPST